MGLLKMESSSLGFWMAQKIRHKMTEVWFRHKAAIWPIRVQIAAAGASAWKMVARDRIELPTRGFSVPCSTD